MKFLHLLPATILVAASFSFNAMSADDVITESPSVKIQESHDQTASVNSILDFEKAAKDGQTANAYQRCSPITYTRYTRIRLGTTKTIASFTHGGGSVCNRYGFTIYRNYDGHDLRVTLVDSSGERVRGGYGEAVYTSVYEAGTYYWEVENKTTTGSDTYGGMAYEVISNN
jgi:hypothetical protein